MRRLVVLFILLVFPTGIAFAATTKARSKAKAAERVHFTDTLSLLSKLATNPAEFKQGSVPAAAALLSTSATAANDVASLGLGELGGDSATVGSDAAADAVSDSIKSLFNLPDQVAQVTDSPVVKPSQPSSAKTSVKPTAKTLVQPVKAPVAELIPKTPPQPVKMRAVEPVAETIQHPKEMKHAVPQQKPKALQKISTKPPEKLKAKVAKTSVPSNLKAPVPLKVPKKKEMQDIKQVERPKAKLLTESFKSGPTLGRATIPKPSVPHNAAVTSSLQKKSQIVKFPTKPVGVTTRRISSVPRKLTVPEKRKGLLATNISVLKNLKRSEFAKKGVSKTLAINKRVVHQVSKSFTRAQVSSVKASEKETQDLRHEKELEAEVAALQAKLAETKAKKVEETVETKPKEVVESQATELRRSEEREAAKMSHVLEEQVRVTLAPIASTAAPERKVAVAMKEKVAEATVVSDSTDGELTMTMVPTSEPAVMTMVPPNAPAIQSVVQVQAPQEPHLSFFGSIFHWFHSLFFGADPIAVQPSPLPRLQQSDPNEGRPPFTRQNVDNTATAAQNDGLADMAIGDEWSRKEGEDIAWMDQVRREDRALRLDAETPKKPSLPAAFPLERSGSTHISNFWQTLADEDADIEGALTQNGDDLAEYDRLKKLQDAKVVASVSEINGQSSDHSALGRRMHLRKGVAP